MYLLTKTSILLLLKHTIHRLAYCQTERNVCAYGKISLRQRPCFISFLSFKAKAHTTHSRVLKETYLLYGANLPYGVLTRMHRKDSILPEFEENREMNFS